MHGNPETGKRVSRISPPEEWIVAEVPELRIADDALWKAVKHRQGEITLQYATLIEATQSARANRLNGAHRPRHLLSGLLECGVCGGPYSMRGQDRYGCINHIMTGTCSNGRGIRRSVIEERVLSELKDRLMAPKVAAEAMRAWAEEPAPSWPPANPIPRLDATPEQVARAIFSGVKQPEPSILVRKPKARKPKSAQ